MKSKQIEDTLRAGLYGAAIIATGTGIIWAVIIASDSTRLIFDRWIAISFAAAATYLLYANSRSHKEEVANLKSAILYYRYDMVCIVSTEEKDQRGMIGKKYMVVGYDQLSNNVSVVDQAGRKYDFKPGEVLLVHRSKFGQKIASQ